MPSKKPSEQQIKANRQNSQKSTGPKSPEGKAAVAQNATKHGLTSRNLVLSDEDAGAFMELRIELSLDFRPVGTYETMLVNRIAQDMWRLQRVPHIEAELFEELAGDMLGRDEGIGAAFMKGCHRGDLFGKLVRYESMISRRVSAAVKELAMLRGTRKGQAALPVNLPATPESRAAERLSRSAKNTDKAADLIQRAEVLRAENPAFLSTAKAEQQGKQDLAADFTDRTDKSGNGPNKAKQRRIARGNANERLRESPKTPLRRQRRSAANNPADAAMDQTKPIDPAYASELRELWRAARG